MTTFSLGQYPQSSDPCLKRRRARKARPYSRPPREPDPVLVDADVPARTLRILLRHEKKLKKFGLPIPWRLSAEQVAIAEKRVRRLRIPPWADRNAIAATYREARRLTIETGVVHHVDHIVPIQGRLVSGLHVENNLCVLVATENVRKHNKFDVC